MSAEVREAMGLLSLTVLAHVCTLSAVPTHRSCHVECAETPAAAARTKAAVLIFEVCFFSFFERSTSGTKSERMSVDLIDSVCHGL